MGTDSGLDQEWIVCLIRRSTRAPNALHRVYVLCTSVSWRDGASPKESKVYERFDASPVLQMTYEKNGVNNRRTRAGKPLENQVLCPGGVSDRTTQLSWMACCSHLWKRCPRTPIWLRWLRGSWRNWISCAPKWPDCGVKIWNCGGKPGIGRADTPMPCGVSRRWNRKTNNSAVRSASCKPNALDTAPRSNRAATAPMNWRTSLINDTTAT